MHSLRRPRDNALYKQAALLIISLLYVIRIVLRSNPDELAIDCLDSNANHLLSGVADFVSGPEHRSLETLKLIQIVWFSLLGGDSFSFS